MDCPAIVIHTYIHTAQATPANVQPTGMARCRIRAKFHRVSLLPFVTTQGVGLVFGVAQKPTRKLALTVNGIWPIQRRHAIYHYHIEHLDFDRTAPRARPLSVYHACHRSSHGRCPVHKTELYVIGPWELTIIGSIGVRREMQEGVVTLHTEDG